MITIQEALTEVARLKVVDRVIQLPLHQALELRLAEPLFAQSPLPRHSQSAMDGFALCAANVTEGMTLKVVAHIPAGTLCKKVIHAGEAARIFTGAPLPSGTDTVLIQENADYVLDQQAVTPSYYGDVTLRHSPSVGEHVRQRGEEIQIGAQLAQPGESLTPGLVGLLASQGIDQVRVYAPPQVAIIETGTELRALGTSLDDAQIYASNGLTLSGMLRYSGAHLHSLTHVLDNPEQLADAISNAYTQGADLVVTTGGVSVGDHDPVHAALTKLNATRQFWKVRMKPGKPIALSTVSRADEERPLISLPGNPVSSVISYLLFVHPLLQRIAGFPERERGLRHLTCRLQHSVNKTHSRAELLRVRLIDHELPPSCELTGGQSSAWISSVADADGLLVLPHEPIALSKGQRVDVALFPWRTAASFKFMLQA